MNALGQVCWIAGLVLAAVFVVVFGAGLIIGAYLVARFRWRQQRGHPDEEAAVRRALLTLNRR